MLGSITATGRRAGQTTTLAQRRVLIAVYQATRHLALAMAAAGVRSETTARLWTRRYAMNGDQGLQAHSHAPHAPRRIPDDIRREVLALNATHPELGRRQIARRLAADHGSPVISAASVANILHEAAATAVPVSDAESRLRVAEDLAGSTGMWHTPAPVVHRSLPDPAALAALLAVTSHRLVNLQTVEDRRAVDARLNEVSALDLSESDPAYRPCLAWAANLRGSFHMDLGQPQTAMDSFHLAGLLAGSPGQPASDLRQQDLQGGNLALAAHYGQANAALKLGKLGEALAQLDLWTSRQEELADPAPHVWRSAVYRTKIVVLGRLGDFARANRLYLELADDVRAWLHTDPGIIDHYFAYELSHFQVLVAQRAVRQARTKLRQLLDVFDLARRGRGESIPNAARIEMQLLKTLLVSTLLPVADWLHWAERALLLHQRVPFPNSLVRIDQEARQREIPGWDELTRHHHFSLRG